MKNWLVQVVAQAYRDQGVPWGEVETLQQVERVAREIVKMNAPDRYTRRKRREHEVAWGSMCDDEDANARRAFREREKLTLENWGCGWNDRGEAAETKRPHACTIRLARRKPEYSKHKDGVRNTRLQKGERTS